MSADETACDVCGYCPRQDDIADELTNISTQSVKVTKLLAELVEAVRALKPAPIEPPTAYIQYFKESDVIEQLRKKLECIRVQSEARGDNLGRAQDEIERLQAKVADDALTIAALKDEAGRATVKIGSLSAELNRERDSRSIQWNRAEQLRAENEQLKENASATLYHEALRLKAENESLKRDAVDPLYRAALSDRARLADEKAELKAENERLRAENAELKAEIKQADRMTMEARMAKEEQDAELKCFREREHKVDALLFGADGCATVLEKNREVRSAQQLRADIAAVRDFKIDA